MKLCRFELVESPGIVRSGFVAQGKVYETDGQQPVGIYSPADIRLLLPIVPPSIRLYSGKSEEPTFTYLNPNAALRPNEALELPAFATPAGYEPCVAAVVAVSARSVPVHLADDVLLGFTLMTSVFAGAGTDARSRDVGVWIGPAITTPEELEDRVTEDERGRHYHLEIGAQRSADQPFKTNLAEEMEFTFAELVAHASESAPLRPGDIIAYSLPHIAEGTVTATDEIAVLSDLLGTLAVRLI